MLALLRRMFRKPAPPEVKAEGERIVVRAAGHAGVARGIGPGMLDMEQVMIAGGAQAMAEGITDQDVVRKRKIIARQALNKARADAMATGKPSSFKIGDQVFTVTP